MHELSICQSIVEAVVTGVEREAAPLRVKSVTLEIGDAAGVEIPALEFCFPMAAEGSVAEGARLEILKVPVRLKCEDCAVTYEPEPGLTAIAAPCPQCGGWNHEIRSGRELRIKHMEVVDVETAD